MGAVYGKRPVITTGLSPSHVAMQAVLTGAGQDTFRQARGVTP